jgi:hypothetical protein
MQGCTSGMKRYNNGKPASRLNLIPCKRLPMTSSSSVPCVALALLVFWSVIGPAAAQPPSAEPIVAPARTEQPQRRLAQPASGEPGAAPARPERPIEYWLEQLDSDQFSRRQVATRQLQEFGLEAVEPLTLAAQSGKLELTQRAIGILQMLAVEQAPDDDGGAWQALATLVTQGSGSAALRARAAIDDIRAEREVQAYTKLAAAGVQLGFREFVMHSRTLNLEVVWIDKKWKGDVDALRWLRWVQRIGHVLIEGDAVRREVIEHVVRMPDLRSLVMRNARVGDDIFTPLGAMNRIDELEFRYVPLTVQDAEKIAQLPIRVSLGLMGTDLPIEGAQHLRDAMPGLTLHYKHGGFLGVSTHGLSANCQLDSVKVGSAAFDAGLRPGDIIVQIDDAPISSFDDLQLQIGSHHAGDVVEMTYERDGEIGKTKVTLGRLEGE